jgi:hypothetical protein
MSQPNQKSYLALNLLIEFYDYCYKQSVGELRETIKLQEWANAKLIFKPRIHRPVREYCARVIGEISADLQHIRECQKDYSEPNRANRLPDWINRIRQDTMGLAQKRTNLYRSSNVSWQEPPITANSEKLGDVWADRTLF